MLPAFYYAHTQDTHMAENIGAYMEQVARHYWGEPTKKSGMKLRWGNKQGREADLRKGVWFDYELNLGGGVVDLVKHCEGATLGGIGKVLHSDAQKAMIGSTKWKASSLCHIACPIY